MDELEEKMRSMHKPDITSDSHQLRLKITLLNAKRSAGIGVFLVLVPCLFLAGIFLTRFLDIPFPSFSAVEEWMSKKDNSVWIKVLIPFLLAGGPLIALAFNLLAILHFEMSKETRELIVTIKLKWFNIVISLTCLLILAIFFLYAVGENK
jgi:hypothetical protein